MKRSRFSQPPLELPRWVRIVTTAVVVAVAIVVPHVVAPYMNFNASMMMFYAVVGLGLNLLTGYTGQISLGHSAFVAIGAYVAVLLIGGGWHYLAVLPVAAAGCFVVGYVIGRPALRLKGLQLALVTLSLAIITPAAIKGLDTFTQGQEGLSISSIAAPEWSGLADDQWTYYICLALAIVAFVVTRRISSGRIGRSLVAVRDYEAVASTLGIRPETTKTTVFAISAAYAGVAGVMYAYLIQFVAPDSFGLTMAIAFLAVIVVGGLSTVWGAVWGAFFVQFVPSLTSGVDQAASGVTYGVTLIVVMFVMPFGVVGLLRLLSRSPLEKLTGSPTPQTLTVPQTTSARIGSSL